MFKRILVILAFTGFFLKSDAQFDTSFAKKNVIHCADSLVYGFRKKNWDVFARYTNPALIGRFGGMEGFKKYIGGTFSQIPDTAWKKYERGKVLQILKSANDLQSVIELITVIEWQGTRISTTSYLVGQSWDGGLFWTFYDSQGDVRAAKTIKPDLSDALVIPPKKEKRESLFAGKPGSQPFKSTPPAKNKPIQKAKTVH